MKRPRKIDPTFLVCQDLKMLMWGYIIFLGVATIFSVVQDRDLPTELTFLSFLSIGLLHGLREVVKLFEDFVYGQQDDDDPNK